MADFTSQYHETEKEKEGLKKLHYLDFVHLATIQALLCLASVYAFAKENSGPLKSGVNAVEGTVKSVIGPVYEKFNGVPFEMLLFADRKFCELVCELDKHMPSLVKKAKTTACTAAHRAPEMYRSIAGEVQRSGVVGTATGMAKEAYVKYEPKAKELYTHYEPVAEHYAVSAWRALNRLPLFSEMAQIVVPTAAHWAEKYNKSIQSAVSNGCNAAQYMPLVPTERIAKVFEDGEKPAGDDVKGQKPVAAPAAE